MGPAILKSVCTGEIDLSFDHTPFMYILVVVDAKYFIFPYQGYDIIIMSRIVTDQGKISRKFGVKNINVNNRFILNWD